MTKPYRHRLVFPTALVLAALTASCGGDVTLPNPGEAADLRIFDGNEQVGPVGAALAEPVVVRVVDTEDEPVMNQQVTFVIASGGGSVEPETATTDADGLASAAWTLDPITCAALVHAQPAVDPVELDVLLARELEERRNPVLRVGMLLLLDRGALDRIGMRLLGLHRQVHGALVGEYVDRVSAS